MQGEIGKERFERLYRKYNRRAFVHPDPLEFLYLYDDPRDREIAGLVASSLAYGRVAQILKSVSQVLNRIGSPSRYVNDRPAEKMRSDFRNFRHRFAGGEELSSLLAAIKRVNRRHGGLGRCFSKNVRKDHLTTAPALAAFVDELRNGNGHMGHLVPHPRDGSACKRLHLFLRWMIRHDDVDPGGWNSVSPTKLVVPLDTHMHRICLGLGFTKRKQADARTTGEVTEAFRKIVPHDPVRYDFSLTRFGIRDDVDFDELKLLNQ